MFENRPKVFTDLVAKSNVEELMAVYEEALEGCGFHSFEKVVGSDRAVHKALWGALRDSEFIVGEGDLYDEENQRFCASAQMSQEGGAVRVRIEVTAWMESRDAPEDFGKSQTTREWIVDEIAAWKHLDELLQTMAVLEGSPLDVPFLPYYGNLTRDEKLRELEARHKAGRLDDQTYLDFKERLESL